jgi:hypothetical protein
MPPPLHFSLYTCFFHSLLGRVGIESDFILDDILDENLQDNINFIDYVKDEIFTDRLSEDLKVPNSFGRRILELCKSTSLRLCNGRFGVDL